MSGFPTAVKNSYIAAMEQGVILMGIPAQFKQRAGTALTDLTLGFTKPKEQPITGSYSESTRIVIIRVKDLPGIVPVKYDVIIIDGHEYALSEVHTERVNDVPVLYRCITHG